MGNVLEGSFHLPHFLEGKTGLWFKSTISLKQEEEDLCPLLATV